MYNVQLRCLTVTYSTLTPHQYNVPFVMSNTALIHCYTINIRKKSPSVHSELTGIFIVHCTLYIVH